MAGRWGRLLKFKRYHIQPGIKITIIISAGSSCEMANAAMYPGFNSIIASMALESIKSAFPHLFRRRNILEACAIAPNLRRVANISNEMTDLRL